MSLYEVILRKPDGLDEVRFTDRELRLGESLRIGGSSWTITGVQPTDHPLAARRYTCVRAATAGSDRLSG